MCLKDWPKSRAHVCQICLSQREANKPSRIHLKGLGKSTWNWLGPSICEPTKRKIKEHWKCLEMVVQIKSNRRATSYSIDFLAEPIDRETQDSTQLHSLSFLPSSCKLFWTHLQFTLSELGRLESSWSHKLSSQANFLRVLLALLVQGPTFMTSFPLNYFLLLG